MITTVVLRKRRQITIPYHICENLGVEEEDLLTIDIKKVIRKEESKEVEE